MQSHKEWGQVYCSIWNCKGIKCNNSSDLESGEDSDLDLDSPETVYIIATEAFYNNFKKEVSKIVKSGCDPFSTKEWFWRKNECLHLIQNHEKPLY